MTRHSMVRVDDVLRLARTPVDISPEKEYRAIGVKSFGRGIFHYPSVVGADLSKLRYFQLPTDALTVSNIKAWEGAIAVTSDEESDCVASNRFLSYLPRRPGEIDVNYLRYFLLSEDGLRRLSEASPGSADRNRTLSQDSFKKLRIPLPDYDEQQRIAATLDSARVFGQEVESRSAEAEAYATHLLSALTTLSCPRAPIGAVAHRVSRPVVPAPQELYSLLGVRWYGKGPFVRERRYGSEVSAPKLYRVEYGDFIYNRLFGWKGAFGFAAEEFSGGFVSGEFPCYRGNEGSLLTEYLHAVCSAETFWKEAQELSRGATPTSRNRLREDEFEAIEIPVPPIEAQERVVQCVRLLSQLRTTTERRDRLVGALQPSLLNAAFSGRL